MPLSNLGSIALSLNIVKRFVHSSSSFFVAVVSTLMGETIASDCVVHDREEYSMLAGSCQIKILIFN